MGFWRRRREETLNEQLLREADVAEPEPTPAEPSTSAPSLFGSPTPVDVLGQHVPPGVPPPEAQLVHWDATATASAPGVAGDHVLFVVLTDGSIVVDEQTGEASLAPLADAVERSLRPPFRAEGIRRGDGSWTVGAHAIEVVRLPERTSGDQIDLIVNDGKRTLSVDGERSDEALPELEQAAARYESFVLHAERLDADLWEVKVSPL